MEPSINQKFKVAITLSFAKLWLLWEWLDGFLAETLLGRSDLNQQLCNYSPWILLLVIFHSTAKPGTCPRPWLGQEGVCNLLPDMCQHDSDCDGDHRCCFNGCQNFCTSPGMNFTKIEEQRKKWTNVVGRTKIHLFAYLLYCSLYISLGAYKKNWKNFNLSNLLINNLEFLHFSWYQTLCKAQEERDLKNPWRTLPNRSIHTFL